MFMRIVAFLGAIALLIGTLSSGAIAACEYQTAKSGDVVASSNGSSAHPQSTPSSSAEPRS
jgi:hypothetical protein